MIYRSFVVKFDAILTHLAVFGGGKGVRETETLPRDAWRAFSLVKRQV